ncbi:MAG: four helix bundle protein [Chloroflexi bacterium]|nr:four helix bundle protein [Chloroflexota bacterium]
MGHAYETSIAWRKADDLAVEVYRVTARFPKSEIYGLTSQMRRAVVSVAANIAEGAARQYMKEYQQFLYMAKASLAELSYHIHLAHRLGLMSDADHNRLDTLRSDAGRPLQGLLEWAERQIAEGISLNKRVSDISELYTADPESPTPD